MKLNNPQETLLKEWYQKNVNYRNYADINNEEVNNGIKKNNVIIMI